MKQNLKNEHGFTLVELMVVLVILGILASIAVPSFTGYIDKQKEKEAIEECHLVVAAAQSMYDDKLTKNNVAGLTATLNYTEVASLAGVNGTVTNIAPISTNYYDGTISNSEEIKTSSEYYYRIKGLTYTAENGLRVKYEYDADTKYEISDDSVYTPLQEYIKDYQQTIKKLFEEDRLKKDGKDNINDQRYYYAVEYLKSTDKTFLEVDTPFLGDHNKDLKLYWQPYYINNGTDGAKGSTSTLLFATPNDGSVTEGVHNGWKAYLVYFNGHVYQCTKKDDKGKYYNSISPLYQYKTNEEIESWLNKNSFKPID